MNAVRSRIAVVVHRLGQGGTDRVAVLLANGFAVAGHPVDLLVFAGPAHAEFASLIDDRVAVRVLGDTRTGRKRELAAGLPAFRRYLRSSRPDALLTSGNNMNWAATLGHLLAGSRARLYLKITNPLLRPRDGPLKRKYRLSVYRLVFGRAHGVLPLSAEDARVVAALITEAAPKLRPVCNPYASLAMLAAPLASRAGRPPHLVAAGRLSAQKNFALLLRAMTEPVAADWRVSIFGEGPQRAMLEALAAELGVAGRLSMPGYVDDLPDRLRGGDVFVLSSDYEGVPAVAVEALAAGLPVVTTDCFPAARELLRDVGGCGVVMPNDPGALAVRIARGLDERPNGAGLRAVAARYSHEAGVRSHLLAMELSPDAEPAVA